MRRPLLRIRPRASEDEAMGWVIRSQATDFHDGPALLVWLERSPAHVRAFDDILARLERLERLLPALREAEAGQPLKRDRSYGGRLARGVGAGALALACAALVLAILPGRLAARRSILTTSAGQSRTLTLETGASVAIGPDARVELIAAKGGARVIMGRGDARFRAPASAPLLVVAGDDLVRVQDASAAVHRRDGMLRISVAGGPVSVGPVSGERGPRVVLPAGSRLDHVEGTTVFRVRAPGASDLVIR